MDKIKKNSIMWDSVGVLIFFSIVAYFLSLYGIDFSFDFDSFAGILTSLFATLLGFILTAFTILFMFDTNTNPTLKKIKKAGLYKQIHERFITTIMVNFIALGFTLIYFFVSKLYSSFLFLNLVIIYLSLLSLVRVYRSLNVLYLIYKTQD